MPDMLIVQHFDKGFNIKTNSNSTPCYFYFKVSYEDTFTKKNIFRNLSLNGRGLQKGILKFIN